MGDALKGEPITVNAICPGLVPTGLLPPAFTDGCEEYGITPTSTIAKAINGFLADDTLTGKVAECSGQDIIYRPSFEPPNEAAKYMLSLSEGTVPAKIDWVGMQKHMMAKREVYKEMEGALKTSS
jgi:NAD(P)-dependent dehydrogenase (short-subunit alcohol dehydrogenase family)